MLKGFVINPIVFQLCHTKNFSPILCAKLPNFPPTCYFCNNKYATGDMLVQGGLSRNWIRKTYTIILPALTKGTG